jgi:hypothetical protein
MNSWIPWENGTLLEYTSGSYESSNPYYPFTSTSIGAT